MTRRVALSILAGACLLAQPALHGQGDGGYRLVPNWPKLPAGMYFGLKEAPPPPAEREAQAAARRAMRRRSRRRRQSGGAGGPTNQPGISGLAIDSTGSHLRIQPRRQSR